MNDAVAKPNPAGAAIEVLPPLGLSFVAIPPFCFKSYLSAHPRRALGTGTRPLAQSVGCIGMSSFTTQRVFMDPSLVHCSDNMSHLIPDTSPLYPDCRVFWTSKDTALSFSLHSWKPPCPRFEPSFVFLCSRDEWKLGALLSPPWGKRRSPLSFNFEKNFTRASHMEA